MKVFDFDDFHAFPPHSFTNAATAALARPSSCSPVAPLMPMPPMQAPSMRIGWPPGNGTSLPG
jgi:hypothetical protein